jgi:tetratricopeptide (TPR) repeat protein
MAACLFGVMTVLAQDRISPAQNTYLVYQQAKTDYEGAPEDAQAAWRFGQSCFDWAEFSTNDTQRAALAREGISACEKAVEKEPELAAAHYYLGMNQGQLARTMNLGALKLVNLMESNFSKARELDADFAHAGPDRNLGLLYLEAPGWPVSLGNRAKARSHLHQAVKLAPAFPENRLNLMEAYERWKETTLLRQELKEWELNLESAHHQFSGHRWREDWAHWEERLRALRASLTKAPPDLRSPKAKG